MADLTAQQATILKAAIAADTTANAAMLAGNVQAVADRMNAASTFVLWKTQVSIGAVGKAISGTELAGLTTANLTRLQTIALYLADGVNPSLADNRAFFDDVFSGAGGSITRPKLLALWKRFATLAEKALATGTGTDAVPGLPTFEGGLSGQDIVFIRDNG